MSSPANTPTQSSVDLLWRVLQRFDFYSSTTNARAPMVAAFNTFLIGGVIIKWQDVLNEYTGVSWARAAAGVLLALSAFGSILSLWYVFMSITPHGGALRWQRQDIAPGAGRSVVFFQQVGTFQSAAEYLSAVTSLNTDALSLEYASQAIGVARVLEEKFVQLRRGVQCVTLLVLPALGGLVLIRLFLTLQGGAPVPR